MAAQLNLGALSPEEKDQLLAHFLDQGGDDASGVPGAQAPEAGEATPDDDPMCHMLKVLEILVSEVEALHDQLSKLQGVVMDDIIGGIDNLYKGNLRSKGVDDLRGKYGEMFGPHMDALKEMSPDEDVFDKLYDMLEAAKAGEGWDDEKEMGTVKSVADGIAAKIAKIKGEAAPVVEAAAEEVKPVTVEKTEVTAAPGREGADGDLMKRIQAMKDKNKLRGR